VAVGFLDRLRGTEGEGTEMSVPADAEMLVGVPAEPPPPTLVAALRDEADAYPEVRTAYLFQMMILAEGEEPHLTLGLQVDDGADFRRIADGLAARAMEVLPEGSYIDVYPLPDDMAEDVARTVEPIYERSA
jgi:SseB protein C-terminal domain